MEILLSDPESQLAFGARLATRIKPPFVLFLDGDLGTGKTTLARGILNGLGHQGPVRSPTYTLIEPYRLTSLSVYHLDLYRLADPAELDYLGLRDLLDEDAIWLVEWPERGRGALPPADLTILLTYVSGGRRLSLVAATPQGHQVIERLASESRSE